MLHHRVSDRRNGRPRSVLTRFPAVLATAAVMTLAALTAGMSQSAGAPRHSSQKQGATTTTTLAPTTPGTASTPTTTTAVQGLPTTSGTPTPGGDPPGTVVPPTTTPSVSGSGTGTGTGSGTPAPAPVPPGGPGLTGGAPTAQANVAPAPAAKPVVPPGPVPPLSSIPSDCSADVSVPLGLYLDSLPPGATFSSSPSACYLINDGLKIVQPLSIIGGTFRDDSITRDTTGWETIKPIIKILDTTGVTLSDLLIEGANTPGSFHSKLVTEAGIKVISSSDVTLTNITTVNTFGDGLELTGDLVHHNGTPVSGLVVDNFTTINAGRQGVTLADVYGATMTGVHVLSPADAGFDFESDEARIGSGDVSISDCTYQHGVNLTEYFTGPVTLTNCTGATNVALVSLSMQPITFVGGQLACQDWNPHTCIRQKGGNLTFSHTTIVRRNPDRTFKEGAWSVVDGGQLTFVDTSIQGSFGWRDASSSVTFAS